MSETHTETIRERKAADLTLESNDISFSKEIVIMMDVVTIYAEIHNIGLANGTNVIINFYDVEDLIGIDTVDVSVKNKENASPFLQNIVSGVQFLQ